MPAWSNISCAQWMWTLRAPDGPFSVMSCGREVSSTGTRSRLASTRPFIPFARPTLVCSITACGRPLTMCSHAPCDRAVLMRHHLGRGTGGCARRARERFDDRGEIGAGIDEHVLDPVRGECVQVVFRRDARERFASHVRCSVPHGGPRFTSSRYSNTPDCGPQHALDVAAPQERLRELPERHIRQRPPIAGGACLKQPFCFAGSVSRMYRHAHVLLHLVARPAGEILAVAGRDGRGAGQRTRDLRAVGAGVEQVPAALRRRVFLLPAVPPPCPSRTSAHPLEADPLQQIGGHQAHPLIGGMSEPPINTTGAPS